MEGRMILRFACELVKSRWMVVVASFFIMSCAGATYLFGLYSGAIKASLKYNQETLDTLGFFKDLGANVGIIAGLLNEVAPPWMVLAVGAGMNLFGYLMIWLSVTNRVARPALWQMYLYICIGANSQTFANTGVIVSCVKNFPQSRGVVLGLLKGFVGLSGAIFTQIYHALYGHNASSLILFIGWLPALISLLFMPFIRPTLVESEKNESKMFFSFLSLALILASFLMILIVVQDQFSLSQTEYRAAGAITILLILLNVGIVVRSELTKFKLSRSSKQEKVNPKSNFLAEAPSSVNVTSTGSTDEIAGIDDASGPNMEQEENLVQTRKSSMCLLTDIAGAPTYEHTTASTFDSEKQSHDQRGITLLEHGAAKEASEHNHIELASSKPSIAIGGHLPDDHEQKNAVKIIYSGELPKSSKSASKWPERGDDHTIPQALLSLDMWILFVASACGIGATLTAIDNMGQIGGSLGYSKASISTFVSLISIWNFLGRVLAGFASEILLQRHRFPRTLMLTIVLGLACTAHLLIASGLPGSLYAASILVGLCFGAQWPVLFAVISELFGLRYFATLHNFGAVASPLGTYLLSVRVAGYLYDKEARKQSTGGMLSTTYDLVCHGKSCFRLTFLIMAAVTAFGSVVSVILVYRTREFYRKDVYGKFRQQYTEEIEGPQH